MGEPDDYVPARGAARREPSQDDLALCFAERHAEQLCYCERLGGWQVYEKGVWARDDLMRAQDCARQMLRELSEITAAPRQRLLSVKSVEAVLRLARSDPRLAVAPEVFDADPWLLNTPGGVVDLRSGEMRAAKAGDYCRRQTSVAPALAGTDLPEEAMEFLVRITKGEETLIEFLQRLAGYCLTGSTREQALFFAYGTGANGKTTLINIFREVLGGYAMAAPMETFMASKHERHPTELAMLDGPRFVTASESEATGWLAAARIKQLTGGDVVSARYMHGNFFQYTPQFKLVLSGNHRPRLRNLDPALRRRIHLIPFTETIPPEERDGELPAKLRQHHPAFLRWMIEGCLRWQQDGLAPPAIVTGATEDYFEDQDALGRWLAERCEAGKDARARATELHADFADWAKGEGEWAMTLKGFGQGLVERGYPRHRTGTGRFHLGLQLKAGAEEGDGA